MALPATTRLVPPMNAPPVTPDGQHDPAWVAHFQEVADQLARISNGVTDGSDAAAGQVGELLTASGGPITLGSGGTANIASLPLSAGDWQVWGNVHFAAAATTHPTQIAAGVSPASAALGAVYELVGAPFNQGANLVLGTGGPVRFSLAAAATAYLVAFSVFTTAGMTATGTIWARRVR